MWTDCFDFVGDYDIHLFADDEEVERPFCFSKIFTGTALQVP